MIPNEDGGAFVPCPGGSVFNTAIGIGRQGLDVGLVSGVSNDLFGELLVNTLKDSLVKTDHLIRSDRPTTLAFVELVDGTASYAFYDENTAGRMLTSSEMPSATQTDVDAIFFGGISLAVEPCASAYTELLKRYSGKTTVMVDPNIRPSFIGNEVTYRSRLKSFMKAADIIKVSDEDLSWIDPEPVSSETKIRKLLESGPSIVCLTLDAQGVQVFGKDGLFLSATPERREVVDTIGAGDAFNAGFLSYLCKSNNLAKPAFPSITRDDLQKAAEFATAFASDTVTRKGSDPGWNFAV